MVGTHPAEPIVLLIICRFLDVVSSNYGRISMVVVAGVGGEVDFSKEFLLVMLEFADHLALLFYIFLDLPSNFAGMKSK